MAARAALVMGPDGFPQALQPGDLIARGVTVKTFTGVCDANGVAQISFGATPFASAPFAWIVEDWAGAQMICGKVTSTTVSGCTAQGIVSRATLLLSAGPFTTAPAGTVITVAVVP